MINKSSIYNITELLVATSVTTAGFLIGGAVGVSVMTGLGINLASNILEKGSSNLKSKWINGKNGILNHDIQRALLRALNKAIFEIEKEYINLEYVKELPSIHKKTIKHFFSILKDSTKKNFNTILTNILNENKIQNYLSKKSKETEILLWKQINLDKIFQDNSKYIKDYYDNYEYDINHLKNYFIANLHYKIKFFFGEELKTDNKENNKAWRAFQRLLLEGIKDEVNSVKENQKENLAKLKKIEQAINKLNDKRKPNELFLNDFEKGINNELETIISINKKINDTTKLTKQIVNKINEITNTTLTKTNQLYEKIAIDPRIIKKYISYLADIEDVNNQIIEVEKWYDNFEISVTLKDILILFILDKEQTRKEFEEKIKNEQNSDYSIAWKNLKRFHIEGKASQVKNNYFNYAQQEKKKNIELLKSSIKASKQLFAIDETIELYKELVKLEPNSLNYSTFGIFLLQYDYIDEAIIEFKRSLKLLSNKISDKTLEDIVTIYSNLGYCYQQINDIKSSIFYHTKAVDILKEKMISIELYVITLNNLAMSLKINNEFEKAKDNYLLALKMNEKVINIDENLKLKNKAYILSNLGVLFSYINDNNKAEKVYNEALNIYKSITNKQDNISPEIGKIIYNLAEFSLLKKREISKSLELFNECLSIYKELSKFDANYLIKVSSVYITLSVFFTNNKEHHKAIDYYKMAIKNYTNYERGLPTYLIHRLANIYNDLANLYTSISNYNSAYHYLIKSLKIYENIDYTKSNELLKGYSTVLNNLGINYKKQNKKRKAIETYYKALTIREKLAQNNNVDLIDNYASTLNNIANLEFFIPGSKEKAIKKYEKVIEIRKMLAKKNAR